MTRAAPAATRPADGTILDRHPVPDVPGCPYPLEEITCQCGRYRVTGVLPSTVEGRAAMVAPAIPQIAELLRGYRREHAEEQEAPLCR